MEKTYPLGVVCDRTKEATPCQKRAAAPALESIPEILGVAGEDTREATSDACAQTQAVDLHVRVAGFGGQGMVEGAHAALGAGLDLVADVNLRGGAVADQGQFEPAAGTDHGD